jgi:hypothetical protein
MKLKLNKTVNNDQLAGLSSSSTTTTIDNSLFSKTFDFEKPVTTFNNDANTTTTANTATLSNTNNASIVNAAILGKLKIFKQSVSDVFSESTMHGITNLFRKKVLLVKVIWFVLFVAGAVAAVYCK